MRNILIVKKKLHGKASKLPHTMTCERHYQVNNNNNKETNQDLEVLEAQYVSPSLSLDDSLLTIVTLEKNSLHEIIDLFYKQF